MTRPAKDGVSMLGLGAVACVACCVGPILAFLGGISIAGVASTWLIGGAGLVIVGLVIAAVASGGLVLLRRRDGTHACTASCSGACTAGSEAPVTVPITTKVDR